MEDRDSSPGTITAYHLLGSSRKLSTGCCNVDRFLAGGIPCSSVTEFVGENGSGKTQLCLQLLLYSLLPFSPTAVSFYVSSEPPLPMRRLRQLADSFLLRLPRGTRGPHAPLDNVFVHSVQTADDLLSLLGRLGPILPRLRLLVVDSVAALFRADFDASHADLLRRSALFFRIAASLKAQAARFGFAVVVTNQVGDVIRPELGDIRPLLSSGRMVSPALGLSWANCINTRIFLARDQEWGFQSSSDPNQTRTIRKMHVVFAPHLPDDSFCEFAIDRDGVHGFPD